MDNTRRRAILLGTIAIVSLITNAKDIPVDRFAVQGGLIRLHCDLPLSDDPDVEWVDKVYGSEQNPEKIFHSVNNPDFRILETHLNRENYRVNAEFTLTISGVDVESDVGEYICTSRIGERIHRKKYYLTIGDLPKCSGRTDLRSGEVTSLSCEMAYSGQNPNLKWLQDGETINSIDEYEIRLAKKVVDVHATHRHDGVQFQCQMTVGSTIHECNLTLNVTYSVHQPKFHPVKETFEPGDEIKCMAKGNPAPSVALEPDFPGSARGAGWAALIVEENWSGRKIQVQCKASNLIGGVEQTKSQNFSFSVSAPRKHEHNHHHHQQQHQHSTAPTFHTQDEENKHIAPGDHQLEEKSVATQKPNVKPVRSDNSAGSLVISSMIIVIFGLITRTLL